LTIQKPDAFAANKPRLENTVSQEKYPADTDGSSQFTNADKAMFLK
jgi:hypothetical protein